MFTVEPVDKFQQPQCTEALTTPVICRPAEAVGIHPMRWSHLRNIAFPEKFPRKEQEIDVLIGFDLYYSMEVHCGEGPMVGRVLRTACKECQDATEETFCQRNVRFRSVNHYFG